MNRLLVIVALVSVLLGAIPAEADQGGPDAFGYTWEDYPTFTWVEINGTGALTGTPVTLGDDSVVGPLPIGFDFNFYGESYSDFYISANGRIMFVNQPETFKIPCIPSVAPFLGYVALYWDDLNPAAGGAVYYEMLGTAPDRYLLVEYDHVLHFGSTTDAVTAEVVLSEKTGDMALQYLDPSSEQGANATIGLMSPDGSTGLSIGCDQAILTPNRNIFIQHPQYIELKAADPYAAVFEGQTAHFDLTVRNVMGEDSGFVVSFVGNTWDAVADPGVFALAAGDATTVGVDVTVPSGVRQWSYDQFQIVVTSSANPAVSASVTVVVTAGPDWVVLNSATPSPVQEDAVVTDTEWLYVFSNYLAPGIAGTLTRFNLDGNVEPLPSLTPAVNTTDGAYLWGKLVFPGGVDATGQITDQFSVYEISEGQWLSGYKMPIPLAYAAAVVLDDRLYVIGGFDGKKALNTLYRFSPDTASWWRLTPMRQARIRPAAGVVGGQIVVAGGDATAPLDSVEVYDPAADTWSDRNPLPMPMHEMADCTCNGTLFLIGGNVDNVASSGVYGYDPVGDSWYPISYLQFGRFSTEAALLKGNMVVVGGMKELFVPSSDAERLDLGCADEEHVIDQPFGTQTDDDSVDDDFVLDDDFIIADDDTVDDDTIPDDDTVHHGDDSSGDNGGCGC